MRSIHDSAVIDASADLGPAVTVGPFAYIGPGVRIGRGAEIGPHVVIEGDTLIGARVRIDAHAVLGKRPMRAVNSATTEAEAPEPLVVGDDCLIGAHAVIYRGACVGPQCLVADQAGIREHTSIGEGTIVGRGAYVENRCTVGRWVKIESMVYVAAYSSVGDRAFLAPMVTVTNDNFVGRDPERLAQFRGVTIERGGRVGANATTLPGAVVESDALVAAGALLRGRAPAGQVLMGLPARVTKPVPEGQRLENQGWPEVDVDTPSK